MLPSFISCINPAWWVVIEERIVWSSMEMLASSKNRTFFENSVSYQSQVIAFFWKPKNISWISQSNVNVKFSKNLAFPTKFQWVASYSFVRACNHIDVHIIRWGPRYSDHLHWVRKVAHEISHNGWTNLDTS